MNTTAKINPTAVVIPITPTIELARILYATDFSEASLAALPMVSTIARKYQSQVLVAHICEPLVSTVVTPETIDLGTFIRNEAHAKTEALLSTPELRDLSAMAVVHEGTPATELKRIVRDQNVDLVVVSTHGRTGLKHLVMGSVAEELIRSATCPVLALGPHVAKSSMSTDLKHILFPTDLSEESRAVFPHLASLASEYGASITVLQVLPIETGTNPDARVLTEPLRHEMKNLFAPRLDPRYPAEFVIDFGDPVERILAHAKTGEAGLIGLGVRKAGEITTHLRNTVTYRVVLQAHCPVLTTRLPE